MQVTLVWMVAFFTQRAVGQVDLPNVPPGSPVSVEAGKIVRWMDDGREVYWLQNGCEITQGPKTVAASEAIVWLDRANEFSLAPHRMTVYAESVKVAYGTNRPENHNTAPPVRLESESWDGTLRTHQPIRFKSTPSIIAAPDPAPEIFDRAIVATTVIETPATLSPAQYNQPATGGIQNPTIIPQLVPQSPLIPGGGNTPRRVRIFPRSNVRMQFDSIEMGDKRVTVVDSGVNILIEGAGAIGTVDISTDRVVIWSPASSGGPFVGPGGSSNALEFYMEGNIVFRQADRVIYATSMYYNVPQESGVVLDAELLSSVPNYPGVVRLRADVLRQLDRSRFQAHQAAITTSRMGVPRYWFQSQDLSFEDRQQ
ncbi:MAG: hypothetical protein AAF497_06780, partial [Planctomycetota bacterium]